MIRFYQITHLQRNMMAEYPYNDRPKLRTAILQTEARGKRQELVQYSAVYDTIGSQLCTILTVHGSYHIACCYIIAVQHIRNLGVHLDMTTQVYRMIVHCTCATLLRFFAT